MMLAVCGGFFLSFFVCLLACLFIQLFCVCDGFFFYLFVCVSFLFVSGVLSVSSATARMLSRTISVNMNSNNVQVFKVHPLWPLEQRTYSGQLKLFYPVRRLR